LKLPRSLNISSDEYERGVHPGVFDACAQLFHAALPRSTDTNVKYMVTRWEDFTSRNQPMNCVLWCHVVLQESPGVSDQLKGRFHLFDENGTVVAQIRGGVMKGLNKERGDALRNYLEASEKIKEKKKDSQIIHALSDLSQDQWRDCLNAYLQQVFAPILCVAANDLLTDEALLDMGMDSIVGMEAKIKLEEELGISLPIEILLVGPSLRELTESIIPLLTFHISDFTWGSSLPS